jgi:glycosyltransferase involved in cell wall biosynthesis
MARLSILVEGWRGINHSYALVNQYQLLQLKEVSGIDLFHKDVPFHFAHWNIKKNYSGLTFEQHQKIVDIPNYDRQNPPDVIYRISSPYNYSDSTAKRIFVFGPPEDQNLAGKFFGATVNEAISNEKFEIITPSNWSSQAFLRAGFPAEKIHIVTHGVDPDLFLAGDEERRSKFRAALGVKDDDFVLLSVSALSWNKGPDILIQAFAKLRQKNKNLKLIIKDQNNLYGIHGKDFIKAFQKNSSSAELSEEILRSIIFLSENLSLAQLQGLYLASDCYVSPYRSEGFNLPPLEASACGIPVIVTRGGPTDDYFPDLIGAQVESSIVSNGDSIHLEPNMDDLIYQIEKMINANAFSADEKLKLSHKIREKYSWEKVSKSLLRVMAKA